MQTLTVGAFCDIVYTVPCIESCVFFRMCAYTGIIKTLLILQLSLLFSILLKKVCKSALGVCAVTGLALPDKWFVRGQTKLSPPSAIRLFDCLCLFMTFLPFRKLVNKASIFLFVCIFIVIQKKN